MRTTYYQRVFVRRANQLFHKLFPWVGAQERREVLARMDALVAERPIHLSLELSTACNAKCVFCAYPKVKRPYGKLSMELFRRICDDFANIGGGCVGLSALISDPLLDPHLIERIQHIAKEYDNIESHVFTNAIRVTHLSDADLSIMLEKLHHIDISIGGLDREEYKRLYGVDMFDRVWASLERLARLRRQLGSPCELAVHIRTHQKKDVLRHQRLQQVVAWGYKCEDILDRFSDWGGLVKEQDLPQGAELAKVDNSEVTVPCLIPMTYMSVLPDGMVNACGCMDTSRDFIIGDLNQQSIAEVWRSQTYQDFRASFRPGGVHRLCKHCSYYRPYSDLLSQPKFKNYKPWQSLWAS